MTSVIEIVKGSGNKAICLTAIGKEFLFDFKKISLPHFESYAKKYGLGLLLLQDYLQDKSKLNFPYNERPNLQRLLFPNFIKENYTQYKYLCDIDIDCLPGPVARNIFDFTDFQNKKNIYLTKPTPSSFSREDIGKRLSVLRNIYQDNKFPLDSLLSGSDDDEKKIYNLNFEGSIATVGTCLAQIDVMSECFLEVYDLIKYNFSGYLQHYTNKVIRANGDIKWLPYEFQAIWNFEVALNYPFLFSPKYSELSFECIMQSLLRVDMLHFAGNWRENSAFKLGPFLSFNNEMDRYANNIPKFLKDKISIKSYGKISDNQ